VYQRYVLLDRWPDDEPRGHDLVTASRRFARRLQTRLDEALEGLAISYAQYEVMEHLAERPNLHAGELGRRLRITRQTAHGLLKQLARADLIDLLPSDGGARPARLTSAGRRRLEHGRQAVLSIHVELEQVHPEKRLAFLDAVAGLDARMAPALKAHWWFS
jgi:DNA-binding MarR family transcriptional regulator